MKDTDDLVADAAAAWARIREHGRKNFDDWIAVARALNIGRMYAMQSAKTNRPVGTKYNRATGQWLRDHGLDGIGAQERYRALLCLENLPEISAWRDGLTEAQRVRLNHPNAIWSHWRRSCRVNEPKPAPAAVEKIAAAAAAARSGKPVFWSQDSVRRAHRAMLDSRSSDLLTLARVALQAAIRSEADLVQLLAEPAQQQPPPPAKRNRAAAQPAEASA